MAVCPYCKDIVPEQEALFCPVCVAAHHPECWESNQQTCSVYGCKLPVDETLLGCPFCEETAAGAQKRCNSCGQPLMNASEIAEFLDSHEWQILPTENDLNPALTAGYLRNSGILARLSKRAPVSMFGFSPRITVWVPVEQMEEAQALLGMLSGRFQPCPSCGHTLFIDEEECSYCIENSGAEA
jgi:hypothetical protein